MAIWQYHLRIIPKYYLKNISHNLLLPSNTTEHQQDFHDTVNSESDLSPSYWLDSKVDVHLLFPLLEKIGPVQEWTKNADGFRAFGDSSANDIAVDFNSNSNVIEELACRVNLMIIDKNFIDNIVSIALQFDCLFLDNKARLFEPTYLKVVEMADSTNARLFVNNPNNFRQ